MTDAPPDSPTELPPGHRSGFVAICGRPNVGKSTLLNAILGEPIAVATPHPQTTREKLLGVWTQSAFQAVFVDTPGIHRARSALNQYMVGQALAGARGVDLVLMLVETPMVRTAEDAQAWQPGEVALEALSLLAELRRPIALVMTKIDRLPDRDLMIPVLQTMSETHPFEGIVPTAAATGEGLDQLRALVCGRLPEGPRYYDGESLSDRPMRWHAAELIRAELFEHLRDEVPYSCAVVVSAYNEGNRVDRISATIFVERASQKGLVIGKGGRMIKKLREGSQMRIANLTGRPSEVHLNIDVAKNWTRDPSKLETMGYREERDS